MSHYYRRRRARPSEYRFLFELKPTLVAMVIAFSLDWLLDVPCVVSALAPTQQACRAELPSIVWIGLGLAMLYGIAAAVYRAYRDFYLGEYWMDLMK